jgi:hypothetical protein
VFIINLILNCIFFNFKMKRLQKSSNPVELKKSIVPFERNMVPFMIKLIKFYETENTIFLLLEYAPLGRLFNYIEDFYQTNNLKLAIELANTKKIRNGSISKLDNDNKRMTCSLTEQQQSLEGDENYDTFNHFQMLKNRRKSLSLGRNISMVGLEELSATSSSLLNKKRSQSMRVSNINHSLYNNQIKMNDSLNNDKIFEPRKRHSSSSSSSSSSESLAISNSKKNESKFWQSMNIFGNIMSNPFKQIANKNSRIHQLNATYHAELKTTEQQQQPTDISYCDIKLTKSEPKVIETRIRINLDSYLEKCQQWMAQLICALQNLHKLGLFCRNLRPDNILLDSNQDLLLSFKSKWSLVDDIVNKKSIDNLYAAPGII